MSAHLTATAMGEACHGLEELLERAIEERDEALSALREVLKAAKPEDNGKPARRGGFKQTKNVLIRLDLARFHALRKIAGMSS